MLFINDAATVTQCSVRQCDPSVENTLIRFRNQIFFYLPIRLENMKNKNSSAIFLKRDNLIMIDLLFAAKRITCGITLLL